MYHLVLLKDQKSFLTLSFQIPLTCFLYIISFKAQNKDNYEQENTNNEPDVNIFKILAFVKRIARTELKCCSNTLLSN